MTYKEFKQEIRNLIIRVHGKGIIDSESAKRVIYDYNLRCTDIDNNDDYFRPLFDEGKTPIEAIESLKYNEDELFRTIDSFSDEILLKEIENRKLEREIIGDTSTYDLEDEILGRWDCELIKPSELTKDELLERLGIEEDNICTSNNLKEIICKVLGFSNSFAYSKEEILKELERVL